MSQNRFCASQHTVLDPKEQGIARRYISTDYGRVEPSPVAPFCWGGLGWGLGWAGQGNKLATKIGSNGNYTTHRLSYISALRLPGAHASL